MPVNALDTHCNSHAANVTVSVTWSFEARQHYSFACGGINHLFCMQDILLFGPDGPVALSA